MKTYKGTGIYLTPEFYSSKAWNDCGHHAHQLYFELYNGLKWIGKGKKKQFTNHDELGYTQTQFCKKYKVSKETYSNARNQLIRVGLISITHKGGNGRGDYTKYKLYYHEGRTLTNNDRERWKAYDGDKKNWEHEKPKSEHRIGIKNRFKKGVGGRKKKTTLTKPPLNGGYSLSK